MASMIKYNLTAQINDPKSPLTEQVSTAIRSYSYDYGYTNWSKYLDSGLRDFITQQARHLVKTDMLKLAQVAQDHQGLVYGGFVRDFLIREQDATDLDLWFTSQDQATAFVAAVAAADQFKIKSSGTLTPQAVPDMYPFQRTQYLVESITTAFSYFLDVVVSAEFPVNDFVNNLVTARAAGDDFEIYTRDGNKINLDCEEDCQINLVTLTKLGVLKAIKDFLPQSGLKKEIRKVVRLTKFIRRGWTILDSRNVKLNDLLIGQQA